MQTTFISGDTINNTHVLIAEPSIEERLLNAFDKSSKVINSKIKFIPEIKIKRENDTLYISELTKTKINTLLVTVEVFSVTKTDKASMPVAVLSDIAQREILKRIKN